LHEGFCIPVLEAQASGLPVIAARSSALPQTVGSAGLTFTPQDAGDLARVAGRVLDSKKFTPAAFVPAGRKFRIAIVAFRYGSGFVGGAEASLRTITGTLHRAGHVVEVFTTCTLAEGNWSNELAEGTQDLDGVPVHRFRIDAHDRNRHLETVRAIREAE